MFQVESQLVEADLYIYEGWPAGGISLRCIYFHYRMDTRDRHPDWYLCFGKHFPTQYRYATLTETAEGHISVNL